jgi:hypothetical protein
MSISGTGVEVGLPQGWDGRIAGRLPEGDVSTAAIASATEPTAVVHAASFPLPADLGDFGSGAVNRMTARDVFVVLLEHGPESIGTPLFAAQGIPRLRPNDFSPATLRMMLPGQSGVQRFFTVNGRPFCLYAVIGAHSRRIGLAGVVNELLAAVRIS